MSDHPNVYIIRPHALSEQEKKWLAKVGEHPTTEDPADGYKPGGILPAK